MNAASLFSLTRLLSVSFHQDFLTKPVCVSVLRNQIESHRVRHIENRIRIIYQKNIISAIMGNITGTGIVCVTDSHSSLIQSFPQPKRLS